ncbi:GGDEF domain-containing protein [Paractinoplanes globisporus]|uniref:GGDEF domain-containing protein n=1 Tax=Paractinoplanes globisporus TaxID=113565 RepID=A0ABW6W4D3_9ACTN|nr:GGDEF domain-containing protein [Actinoplanes globisporus]
MKRYAVLAAVAIAAYQLIPADGWWTSGWQLAIGYLGVAGILAGTHRLPRRDRLPWWCFAFGVGANVTGIPVSIYCVDVLGWQGLPTPADPLFLLLYPACALGLALLIRRREPRRNRTAVVDAATITTGLGLLAWVYVIKPATLGQDIDMLGRAVQAAYPIGDLLLLAMMTRLLRGGGRRGAPFWWITGSLGAFLLGDTAWVVVGSIPQIGAQVEKIQWFSRSIDMVFLVAFVLFGLGALHNEAREVGAAASPEPVRLGRIQLALLAAASLIAPGLLAVQLAQGRVRDGWAIVIGCTVLFLLVVLRMAQLVREVERRAAQVRDLARRDELTGLPNRRVWNEDLPRALEFARRDRRPMSVALLDLDHFKLFNDTFGHPAGDRLLKEASAAWHGALRAVDLLARYGGEEFVVLLPDADEGEAREIMERVLAATPQEQTFSAGIAVWDGDETPDQLVARADAALYAAKNAGRNRVTV